MKKLLTLFLITFALNSYANTQTNTTLPYYDKVSNRIITPITDGVQTIHQDAVTLVKTVDERLSKALIKAAPVLKVGAENVWNTLVKQQRVWAYMWTFILFVNLFIWYSFRKLILSASKLTGKECDAKVAIGVICGILGFIGTGMIATNWTVIWTGYFNPDYGAIIQLAEFAKSL